MTEDFDMEGLDLPAFQWRQQESQAQRAFKARRKLELAEYQQRCRRIQCTFQGCACPHCAPELYKEPVHLPDRKAFHVLDPLSFRAHDAMHIANIISSALSEQERRAESTWSTGLSRWRKWKARFPPDQLRQSVPFIFSGEARDQLVSIFNDLFFLGQFSTSHFRVGWCKFESGKHGETRFHADGSSVILLNSSHPRVRYSLNWALRVLLHEMIHAFFNRFTCNPYDAGKEKCLAGKCARLFQANLGATGHGRAFQLIAHTFEAALPRILGIRKGVVGCQDGLATELAGLGCLPCAKDFAQSYSFLSETARARMLRSRDDSVSDRWKGVWSRKRRSDGGRRRSI